MSAKLLVIDAGHVMRAKNSSSLFIGVARHGCVGWYKEGEGSDWVELRFWNYKSFCSGWITVDEYIRRKNQIRQDNVRFYLGHPEQLRAKIDAKRRPSRLLRITPTSALGGWATA